MSLHPPGSWREEEREKGRRRVKEGEGKGREGDYGGGFFMLEEVAEVVLLQWKMMKMWWDQLWMEVVMDPVSSRL